MRPREEGREQHRKLVREVERKAFRRMRAARKKDRSLWFGFGAFGVVGWSVALPALIGIALGVWLDGWMESPFSWTLTLLIVGVCLGCANAWFWLSRAEKQIRDEREEDTVE